MELGTWLQILGAVGQVAGAASKGAAQGRQAEADLSLQRDRNRLDQYGLAERGTVDRYGIQQRSILDALGLTEKGTMDRAGLDLAQKQFALNAPQTRGKTALMGDMLSRGTNMRISHPRATIPQMTGGYTYDSMSPEMREMGRTMLLQALTSQKGGDQFTAPPMADFNAGVLAPPAMTPPPQEMAMPKAGKGSMLMNILAGLGGAAGAISPYLQRSSTVSTAQPFVPSQNIQWPKF